MTLEEMKHTPGPWGWFGNAGSNSVYLATVHGGRRFVMDFTRWGMRGAQPRFQTERGIMVDAKDLLQFEVGDRSIVGVEAARNDTSVYRLDVRGIASADARLIAAAPELFHELYMQVRNCPVCKGTGKAVDVLDIIMSDGPHEDTDCGRCASSRAALSKAGASS